MISIARSAAAVSVVKKGLPVPAAQIDHPALLQMADGAAADVVFTDLVDADGRHDTRIEAETLQRILHRQRVHDGGEHAHVVCRHPVHAGTRQACAAKDIAAADDDRELHAEADDLLQLPGDALEHGRIDAIVGAAHEGFPRQLHENAGIASLRVRAVCHTPNASSERRVVMEKTPPTAGLFRGRLACLNAWPGRRSPSPGP